MQAPSYDQVATLLSVYGDAMSVPECHGVLCGMVSADPGLDGNGWAVRMLSGDLDGALANGAVVAVDEADKAVLRALFDDTLLQMNDAELAFQLLLPDEDEDEGLEGSLAALADWCEGYLYGLSLGGVKSFDACTPEVQEFCGDLVEISHITFDAGDEGDNETALFEIVEYVRMGTLMVYEELSNPSAGRSPRASEHKITFH